jgi:two-component system nitrogen regulation response regulator GlnG
VHHFFALAAEEGLPRKEIDTAAIERLKRHRWPGNVRELENLVRRLAALYPQEVITENLIAMELEQEAPAATASVEAGEQGLGSFIESYLGGYFGGFGDSLPPPGLYHRFLREVEPPLISAALTATDGNQIKAAELLGLNRNTLRKKIRDLNIRVIRGSH